MNASPVVTARGYMWAAAVFALWLFGPALADTLASIIWRLFA